VRGHLRPDTSHIVSIIIVIVVPIACLVPFVGKAFHIDDTLYIWTAQHILARPLDFFGFSANWYGFEMPMWHLNKNPPLASYYMALVGLVFGWSETALHIAFLIPAAGLSLGTYYLARRLCGRPQIAALVAVLSPVFLVSSSSVMTDTPMVALFVWAAALWLKGLEEDSPFNLFASSLLIACSALTKYFGMTLIPLLFVYSCARRRSLTGWVWFLLVPAALLAGYELLTYHLYGAGLVASAVLYEGTKRTLDAHIIVERTIIGLSFTGGCLASVAFFAPLLWARRWWAAAGVVVVILAAIAILVNCFGEFCLMESESVRWGIAAQLAMFVAAGLHVLVLACDDLSARRDAGALLLFLWIVGTLVFTTFVNWTTNGRTILPLAPAAAILVVRRLERVHELSETSWKMLELCPLIPAAAAALIVTWADHSLAECQRTAAREITADLKGYPHTVWFQGHWGFQHYMEAAGARSQSIRRTELKRGELVVVAVNNTNLDPPPESAARVVAKKTLMPFPYVATMDPHLGAGFYSDLWGPLPFAVGRASPEQYLLYVADPRP